MNSQRIDDKSIFNAVRRIVDRAAREQLLITACGGDVAAVERIRQLLSAHDEASRFLESPACGALLAGDLTFEGPGATIGTYTIVEQIGEGGFGVVFLAEQERPVRRRVALKVIKPGMDTREVISRFEAERQALAIMDHPHIAKVFDAGTTDHGRPYFVMELVHGVPITDYCDECCLSTIDRLELFIVVCQAVHHAHQKGVIHRDIKPSNVLVAIQDGRPAPKIIDFGVAKAVNQPFDERSLQTAFTQIIGTPLYMSPEQAELSPLGVDTRSDIYSLGALLYELLTSETPFRSDRLQTASYDELRRIIREEEPPRPSARISTLAAECATTVAERRRTVAKRLSDFVRGDLDWIVMKCLEKDRNRRYESVTSLSQEIGRYLRNEPVLACPPSARYRLQKFVRRNRPVLLAGAAVLSALIVGLGTSTWLYLRERRAVEVAIANESRAKTESLRATAVSELLQEMLGSADPGQAKGAAYTVRELLDDFSAGVKDQLIDQPAVEADIHLTIGRAYRSLSLPDLAEPHFVEALSIQSDLHGPKHEKVAAVLVDYGWNFAASTRYFEAEAQLRKALNIYRELEITGAALIHALRILQHVLIAYSRDLEAERITQQAIHAAKHDNLESADLANMLHRYSDLQFAHGRLLEAEKFATQAIDMHRRFGGDRHPETAFALLSLGRALAAQQKYDQAEAACRESVGIFRHSLPEESSAVRKAVDQLNAVLQAQGDSAEIEQSVTSPAKKKSPSDLLQEAKRLLNTKSQTSHDDARPFVREAIEVYARVAIEYPRDLNRRLNAAAGRVAILELSARHPELAHESNEVNRQLTTELVGLPVAFPDSRECRWRTAMTHRGWANVLVYYDDYLSTLVNALQEATRIFEQIAADDPNTPSVWSYAANTYGELGAALDRSGRPDEAEQAYRRAMAIYERHAADFVHEFTFDHARFATFLATTGRSQEAIEIVNKAADALYSGLEQTAAVASLHYLALAQLNLGDETGYHKTCDVFLRAAAGRKLDDFAQVALCWTYAIGPQATKDLSKPLAYAEQNIDKDTLGAKYFDRTVLGALHFRAGNFDRGAKELEAAIAEYPSDPPPGVGTILLPQLFLAMTRSQQGRQGEARRQFASVQTRVAEAINSQASVWQRRAVLEILNREAEIMILPKGADHGSSGKVFEPNHGDLVMPPLPAF